METLRTSWNVFTLACGLTVAIATTYTLWNADERVLGVGAGILIAESVIRRAYQSLNGRIQRDGGGLLG
jgi:hypothetical protein